MATWLSYPATLVNRGLSLCHDYPTPASGLALIGGLWALSFGLNFLRFFFQTFLLPGTSLSKYGAKKGAWAVVTGATDGIGREFAMQLAKAGFNVFLASRSPEKLAAVAAEIEAQYKVITKTHTIDFSSRDDAAYVSLGDSLKNLNVTVLVNNVGKSHDMPVYFDETPVKEMNDILEINIHATLNVTRLVLPYMLFNKKGLILNISSFAGSVPSPMLATYSGSKAFLSTWTQALAEEYRSRGITVQLVNTYFVVSAMSKIRRASMMIPTPKAYVKAVLSKIGLPCGAIATTATSTPYWSHAVLEWIIAMLAFPAVGIRYTHTLHQDIRKRALRKQEREAAKTK